jgi:hypothetical protein
VGPVEAVAVGPVQPVVPSRGALGLGRGAIAIRGRALTEYETYSPHGTDPLAGAVATGAESAGRLGMRRIAIPGPPDKRGVSEQLLCALASPETRFRSGFRAGALLNGHRGGRRLESWLAPWSTRVERRAGGGPGFEDRPAARKRANDQARARGHGEARRCRRPPTPVSWAGRTARRREIAPTGLRRTDRRAPLCHLQPSDCHGPARAGPWRVRPSITNSWGSGTRRCASATAACLRSAAPAMGRPTGRSTR